MVTTDSDAKHALLKFSGLKAGNDVYETEIHFTLRANTKVYGPKIFGSVYLCVNPNPNPNPNPDPDHETKVDTDRSMRVLESQVLSGNMAVTIERTIPALFEMQAVADFPVTEASRIKIEEARAAEVRESWNYGRKHRPLT